MSKLWLPNIWTPRKAGMRGAPLIEGPTTLGFSGHVTMVLRDAETQRVVKKLDFHNILCNAFFESSTWGWLAYNSSSAKPVGYLPGLPTDTSVYFAVGSGNTAPTATDSALVSELSGRTSTYPGGGLSGYTSGSPDSHYTQIVRQFSTAQGNGTIREIGMWSGSSGGTLFARALLADGNGNPTSLEKTSSQTLEVKWEIRMRPIQGDVTDTVVLGGVSYTLTYRAANVGLTAGTNILQYGINFGNGSTNAFRWQTALVARTAAPPSASAVASASPQAYVPGTLYRDIRVTPAAAAATAAISGMIMGNTTPATSNGPQHGLQIGFSPSLSAGQALMVRVACARL